LSLSRQDGGESQIAIHKTLWYPAKMKNTLAALSALVLSLFLVGAIATPAQAASPHCGNARVCLWDGPGFGGTVAQAFSVTSATCKSLTGQPTNNIASTGGNGTGYYVDFYNSHNCSGTPVYNNLAPGTEVAFLGSANNVISSFRTSLVP
jgi:hypothetical protein